MELERLWNRTSLDFGSTRTARNNFQAKGRHRERELVAERPFTEQISGAKAARVISVLGISWAAAKTELRWTLMSEAFGSTKRIRMEPARRRIKASTAKRSHESQSTAPGAQAILILTPATKVERRVAKDRRVRRNTERHVVQAQATTFLAKDMEDLVEEADSVPRFQVLAETFKRDSPAVGTVGEVSETPADSLGRCPKQAARNPLKRADGEARPQEFAGAVPHAVAAQVRWLWKPG